MNYEDLKTVTMKFYFFNSLIKISLGKEMLATILILSFPSFCCSKSFLLLVMSPPYCKEK